MKKADVLAKTGADFKAFLNTGRLESSKPYTTTIEVENGSLSLQLKTDQLVPDKCFLVLVNEENSAERIVIQGDILRDKVVFNLASSDVPGPETCGPWLAYFACESSEECYAARIKRKLIVKANEPKTDAEKGVFSRIIKRAAKRHDRSETAESVNVNGQRGLWEAREVYTNTGIEQNYNGKSFDLVLRFTAKGQRMILRWIAEAEAQPIFDGHLFYMRREEKQERTEFDFSVVMAVYKVEDYLKEAIDSLIAQDIGFEEHIQLILVDDGSPDRSGEICDEYAKLYPNNIQVIHK